MNRRRALVVVPVLLLCVGGLWLLARGERDDPRRAVGPAGPTTTTVTEAGPTTARPGPILAPPTEAPPPAPRPATEAAPTATEAAPGPDGPTGTPAGVRLRGVHGRVVSAADGQPIAGAFVSWGAPPHKVLEAIRSSPALLQAGEGGELSDAGGRFELPRVDDLTPRAELFATAAGWVQASTLVGLREDVELRLQRAGRLVVRFTGEPPDELAPGSRSFRRQRGVLAVGPAGARHAAPRGEWPPVLEVVPGRWSVQLDGGAPVDGVVQAGSTTTIEVSSSGEVQVEGQVTGVDEPALRGAQLELVRLGELGSTAPALARSEYVVQLEGRTFREALPQGVYAARVRLLLRTGRSGEGSEVSERAIAAPVRIAPPGPVTLELALTPAATVEVRLVGLEPFGALGLVGADGDPPELIALPLEGRPTGSGARETSRYVGAAPAGTWWAFAGPTLLGEVDLAEGTPVTLTVRPLDVTVRWRVPDALRDGEVLRGALAVVPAELARRPVGARFREEATEPFDASRGGEPFRLQLLAPGRYLLCGSTDLGPFEREVELTGATEVEVDLTGK